MMFHGVDMGSMERPEAVAALKGYLRDGEMVYGVLRAATAPAAATQWWGFFVVRDGEIEHVGRVMAVAAGVEWSEAHRGVRLFKADPVGVVLKVERATGRRVRFAVV